MLNSNLVAISWILFFCNVHLALGSENPGQAPARRLMSAYDQLSTNEIEATSGTPGRVFQLSDVPQAGAFEVGDEYDNCFYGHPTSWTWETRNFCCSLSGQEIDAWHQNFKAGTDFCLSWGFATSTDNECDRETGPRSPMCPMAGCRVPPGPGCVIKHEFHLTEDGCCPKLCNFVDSFTGEPCGQDWLGDFSDVPMAGALEVGDDQLSEQDWLGDFSDVPMVGAMEVGDDQLSEQDWDGDFSDVPMVGAMQVGDACWRTRNRWVCMTKPHCDWIGSGDNFPGGRCSNVREYTPGGEYNCRYDSSQSSWHWEKRQFCCARPEIRCKAESEFTPGGEYNCRFGRPSTWTWRKRNFCCSNPGTPARDCNSGPRGPSPGGPSIGRRAEVEETTDEIDSLELETADDLDRRRQSGRYNCWTRDLQSRWSSGKKRWCCDRYNIACQRRPVNRPVCCQAMTATCLSCKAGVSKAQYCARNPRTNGCSTRQNEFTPGGEYNCRFGNPSSWTWQKRNFCCSRQRIGCNSGSRGPSRGGPSIGRRAEVEESFEEIESEDVFDAVESTLSNMMGVLFHA